MFRPTALHCVPRKNGVAQTSRQVSFTTSRTRPETTASWTGAAMAGPPWAPTWCQAPSSSSLSKWAIVLKPQLLAMPGKCLEKSGRCWEIWSRSRLRLVLEICEKISKGQSNIFTHQWHSKPLLKNLAPIRKAPPTIIQSTFITLMVNYVCTSMSMIMCMSWQVKKPQQDLLAFFSANTLLPQWCFAWASLPMDWEIAKQITESKFTGLHAFLPFCFQFSEWSVTYACASFCCSHVMTCVIHVRASDLSANQTNRACTGDITFFPPFWARFHLKSEVCIFGVENYPDVRTRGKKLGTSHGM